jgi:hypothetical protein
MATTATIRDALIDILTPRPSKSDPMAICALDPVGTADVVLGLFITHGVIERPRDALMKQVDELRSAVTAMMLQKRGDESLSECETVLDQIDYLFSRRDRAVELAIASLGGAATAGGWPSLIAVAREIEAYLTGA